MISVAEAKALIEAAVSPLSPVKKSPGDALGLVLAEDVFAKTSVPPFHQSAMDGYAFCYADYLQANEFIISGEVAAGGKAQQNYTKQTAVRIFTGAPLPAWADTVVMQEKTTAGNGKLLVNDDQLLQGSNVRGTGSEISKGETALRKGDVMTPAAIGYLAGVGITDVPVHPKPSVHLIVTGNELQQPGEPLQAGQVYESNSFMLKAALQQLHINTVTATTVSDDLNALQRAIADALQEADVVLLTGGVSVGAFDFVVPAAEACGVKKLFHKVAQRPGKPLYCGTKDGTVVFGLPGNPASVLSCFYNYVVVAIERLTGRGALLERRWLPLLSAFNKTITFTQFLKAACTAGGVLPLGAQESFRLSSFASANCLIILPEGEKEYKEGDTVETLVLPYL